MRTTWMLVFTFLAYSSSAFARERYEFYNGVRSLGMGGTVVCTTNDETAIFSNPAALGKLRNLYFTVADPEAAGNAAAPGILSKGSGGTLDFHQDPQKLLDKLNLSPDKHFHLSGRVSPSFVVPNFGVGLLGQTTYDAEVVSATNTYDLRYVNDTALAVGFALRIWDGRIKVGASARAINRVEIDESLSSTATTLTFESLLAEGGGLAGDAAVILTGPWAYLPSIGAVLRDSGGTKFDLNDGFLYDTNRRPSMVQQTIDVGFSISPILANHARLHISGEYRDLPTYNDETDQFRRAHLGVELNFSDTFFLRAGMNQRYYTAGLEISMIMFQLQFATYGEEIGTTDLTREDRRYVGKLAIRF